MDLRETYNLLAKDWARDHYTDTWSTPAENHFCSLLSAGAAILDVGCGPGLIGLRFAAKGFKVTGIDLSEEMIALAKVAVPSGRFSALDMRELDQIKETFDGVFARASLLHIPKNEAAEVVGAMACRLKSGGVLFMAVKEVREGRGEEEMVKESDYGYDYERFFSYYRQDEILAYMHQAGVTPIFEEFVGEPGKRWIIVMGRK